MKLLSSLGFALLTTLLLGIGSASALDVNWTGTGDGFKISDVDNWDVVSGLYVNNRTAIIDQADYSGSKNLLQSQPGLDIESMQFTGTSGGSKNITLSGLAMKVSGNGGNGAISSYGDSQVYIENTILSDSGNISATSFNAQNSSLLVLKSPYIDLSNHTALFTTKSTSALTVDSVLKDTNRVVFAGAGSIYTMNNFETTAAKTIINTGSRFYPRGDFGNMYVFRDAWVTPQTCVDTGNLYIKGYSRVRFPIGGDNSCLGYSRLNVSGVVKVFANSKLSLIPTNYNYVTIGAELWLIRNDGNEPIYGRFLGYPEGKQVTVGSTIYSLSYRGGDGNDLTLTAIDIVQGK